MNLPRILAAATLALSLGALAPAHAHGRDHGRDYGAELIGELDLDAAKSEQVNTILREQGEKRQAIWKEKGDREAAMEKMRALHEETKTRLATVLDEAQMAKIEERMDKRRGYRDDRRDDRRERGGEYITQELGLDAAQKEKVQAIFADTHAKREAIFDSDADRNAKHAQMAALHGEVRGKMEQILTADQMKRFDEMHARHMERMTRHMERRGRGDDGADKQDTATP